MRRRPKLLSSTRPAPHRVSKFSSTSRPSSLSSKKGRTLIRTFHTLQKQHAAAVTDGDQTKAGDLQKQMDALGGLEAYQKASLNGQKGDRGGDSSAVLVSWLKELESDTHDIEHGTNDKSKRKSKVHKRLHVLEIGSLSPTNCISRYPGVDMTRIDLHSQDPRIEQQDFMARPLPADDDEKFDLISLSLVLNYVPDATGKGEMLKRTCTFLKGERKSMKNKVENEKDRGIERSGSGEDSSTQTYHQDSPAIYPCLFLVLPLPCIDNSRYLDDILLRKIMESLGYFLLRQKSSAKLAYSLWRWDGPEAAKKTDFTKKEIRPGGTRNNFCIVLK